MTDGTETHSVAENALANQAIQTSKSYGGNSGNKFTLMSGNYITTMTMAHGTYYSLEGIVVEFDNDSSATIGSTTGAASTTVVDLSQDSVSKLYVQAQSAEGYGSGIGITGLYLETVRGNSYSSDPSSTPITAPESWQPVLLSDGSGPVANAVLVGLSGMAGDAIDSISFFFKNDVLMSHGMTDVVYSDFANTPSTPLNVATATLSNQTDQAQQMSISFSESVASTYTFSTTAGATAGLSTTVEAGLPYVAKGQVQVSATVSFSATIGVAKTVTDSFSYNANVNVPAGETIQASAVASTYTISGSYTANFSEVWVHAGAVTRSITGTISGVSAYDVTVNYTSSDGS